MSSQAKKTSFGYRLVSASEKGRFVGSPEKRRLVNGHFHRIARRYDLANALFSFGLHLRWRRWGIEQLALKDGERVLDLCGGTGDLALRAAACVAPHGEVLICDINRSMMLAGRVKSSRSPLAGNILFVEGDAERASFGDETFDAVTVGFGIRNLVSLDAGLSEMHRVLKPGGRIMVLEFSLPVHGWMRRLYDCYSFRLMPLGARIICGTAEPYRYLAESIRAFDTPERVAERLGGVGFSKVRFRRLTGGIAVVYLAERP